MQRQRPARALGAPTAIARASSAAHGGLLQRKCACGGKAGSSGTCAECEEKQLQRKSAGDLAATRAPAIVHDVLRSPGRPLEGPTRRVMEARFGRDFGDVRVHLDGNAARSAQTVSAHAYTVAPHIVFGTGQYAPTTTQGTKLLAHELTHVVQQPGTRGVLQPDSVISAPADAAEIEADAAAERVAAGESVRGIGSPAHALVQRQEKDRSADDTKPAEKPLSRAEEVTQSRTSPGRVGGTAQPPLISVFNFAIDSAALKAEHKAALAEVADLIKQSDAAKVGVMVIGHADSSGTPDINRPLSQRRAAAVQQELARLSGRVINAEWAGDTRPVASNDTVDGRSRNRRVDIFFLPLGGIKPSDGQPPPTGDQPEKKASDKTTPSKSTPEERPPPPPPGGDDDRIFCAKHPIICAGIGLGAAGLLFCILNPASCLPSFGGGAGGAGGGDKDKEKDKNERPCVDSSQLPSGTIKARAIGGFLLGHFTMRVTFRNDETGCSCRLGEYKQEIRGFAERDDGTGVMHSAPPPGIRLDRTTFQEDLRDGLLPYGVRSGLIGNTDKDQFLPDRETGCDYKGVDDPGMSGGVPGEHMRFRFEFRGGPVDRRLRSLAVETRNDWVVEGDHTVPKPQPPTKKEPPQQPPPTPTPTPEQKDTKPPPPPAPDFEGPSIGPPSAPPQQSLFCLGGSIGCETLDFMRKRGGKFLLLSDADKEEAINIEQRLLIQADPTSAPVNPAERLIWREGLRLIARKRVNDILAKTITK